MVAPLAAMARPCQHAFCGTCLSLCARARLPAALTCPLCRTPVTHQEPTGTVDVTPLPDPVTPRNTSSEVGPHRRPRVNEQYLSEHELHVYLNFVAPVLSLGPPPPPQDEDEDWS